MFKWFLWINSYLCLYFINLFWNLLCDINTASLAYTTSIVIEVSTLSGIMLSFSATTRSDTTRKNGKETQQNRDAYVGQELHNGPDKRHMRNAWRGATVYVSSFINSYACSFKRIVHNNKKDKKESRRTESQLSIKENKTSVRQINYTWLTSRLSRNSVLPER